MWLGGIMATGKSFIHSIYYCRVLIVWLNLCRITSNRSQTCLLKFSKAGRFTQGDSSKSLDVEIQQRVYSTTYYQPGNTLVSFSETTEPYLGPDHVQVFWKHMCFGLEFCFRHLPSYGASQLTQALLLVLPKSQQLWKTDCWASSAKYVFIPWFSKKYHLKVKCAIKV